MILCNMCEYHLKQGKHEESLSTIEKLTTLNCGISRYQRAVELIQIGIDKVKKDDPVRLAKYQKLHALFESRTSGKAPLAN